jgi:hypothetical protein
MGKVCSCLGPVIDISLAPTAYEADRAMSQLLNYPANLNHLSMTFVLSSSQGLHSETAQPLRLMTVQWDILLICLQVIHGSCKQQFINSLLLVSADQLHSLLLMDSCSQHLQSWLFNRSLYQSAKSLSAESLMSLGPPWTDDWNLQLDKHGLACEYNSYETTSQTYDSSSLICNLFTSQLYQSQSWYQGYRSIDTISMWWKDWFVWWCWRR